MASGQRLAKRQPGFGSTGLVNSPCMMMRLRLRRMEGTGMADSRPFVEGWSGAWNSHLDGHFSTMEPTYITRISSEMCLTTDISWVTKI